MVSTISLRRRLLARGIYFLLHLCLASRDVRASRSGPRENLRATVIAYVHMGCGTGQVDGGSGRTAGRVVSGMWPYLGLAPRSLRFTSTWPSAAHSGVVGCGHLLRPRLTLGDLRRGLRRAGPSSSGSS